MPTPKRLGEVQIGSTTIVVSDPGYYGDALRIEGLGCVVESCAPGRWLAELLEERTPQRPWEMPRFVWMFHERIHAMRAELTWARLSDEIGGDSGMVGVYDLGGFHDATVVPNDQVWTFDGKPADPSDLWYSYLCELMTRNGKLAEATSFGVTVNWDGGMDVDVFRQHGEVVALRLAISGWPDNV